MPYAGVKFQTPGVGSLYESVEKTIGWGDGDLFNMYRFSGAISGASRDGDHTGSTTILRPGLLMGFHHADELWLPYDSGLTADEGDTISAIFVRPVDVQINSTDTIRWGGFLVRPGASIRWSQLVTNDTGSGGSAGDVSTHANKSAIRTRLEALGYLLDDWHNPPA